MHHPALSKQTLLQRQRKTTSKFCCVLIIVLDIRLYRSNRESPAQFAALYRKHDLRGGHVIKLGQGNDEAARSALAAWPGAKRPVTCDRNPLAARKREKLTEETHTIFFR